MTTAPTTGSSRFLDPNDGATEEEVTGSSSLYQTAPDDTSPSNNSTADTPKLGAVAKALVEGLITNAIFTRLLFHF